MATYYCATTGNDISGDGSIGNPWATWEKLGNSLSAGDIGYVRGGTYTNTRIDAYQCLWDDLTGTSENRIKIWAYPDEIPIWDLVGMPDLEGEGVYQCACVEMNQCDYLWIKGLTITRFYQQDIEYHFPMAWNMVNSSHNIIEHCTADDIGGYGFSVGYDGYNQLIDNVENSEYNLYLNCDAFACADPYSTNIYENANGFNIMHNGDDTPDNNPWCPNTIFRGCRAAFCSDDGWDLYGADGYPILIENCWSYYNGLDKNLDPYPAGPAANGFKLGPNYLDLDEIHAGTIVNCVAAGNTECGILINDHDLPEHSSLWHLYNNLVYYNETDGSYSGITGAYWSHLAYVFRNNIAYKNRPPNNYIWDALQVPEYWDNSVYNTWNSDGSGWNANFTVSDADFESLTISQLNGSRQSNGNLPVVTFGHLVVGSDLIEGGIDVGYPYDGDAPDLGPYWEYEGAEETDVVIGLPKIHNWSTV